MRINCLLAVAALASVAAEFVPGQEPPAVKQEVKKETATPAPPTAKTGKESPAPLPVRPANPKEVEVRFMNGSRVIMLLEQEQIEVVTKFGKLTIPPTEIKYIEFALHMPPGVDKQIEEAVSRLSSPNYKQREAALKELVGLGAYAYRALQKPSRALDMESAQRIKQAIKAIEQKVPASLLKARDEDVIQTSKFAVAGRIVTPTIRAKAEYFGNLELRPTQLRSIRQLAAISRTEVVVDAAKHGKRNAPWMDSGFKVEANSRLVISASGEVDLNPQAPGQMVAGPAGMNNNAGVRVFRGGPPGAENLSPGILLAKIGDKGQVIVVGDRYEGTAPRTGNVYLYIYPLDWGMGSTGSYQVRLSSTPRFGDEEDD